MDCENLGNCREGLQAASGRWVGCPGPTRCKEKCDEAPESVLTWTCARGRRSSCPAPGHLHSIAHAGCQVGGWTGMGVCSVAPLP